MRMPLCTLALAVLLVGCGGSERDALRKELDVLQQDMGRLRAENNILAARVETLELARQKAAAHEAQPSTDDDRPSLDVVHLAPTAEPSPVVVTPPGPAPTAAVSADDEDGDDAPRPVLRSTARGEVIAQPLGQAAKSTPARPDRAVPAGKPR
jgi:hypothetical protein